MASVSAITHFLALHPFCWRILHWFCLLLLVHFACLLSLMVLFYLDEDDLHDFVPCVVGSDEEVGMRGGVDDLGLRRFGSACGDGRPGESYGEVGAVDERKVA
jgi:hypothetical protein